MRRWAWALGLALAVGAPAQAQYVFDPADLPEDFECDPDPEAGKCEYQKTDAAWMERYFYRYDAWTEAMLHRPEAFFEDKVEPLPDFEDEISASGWSYEPDHRTPNLVDATFEHGNNLTRNWAFAISADGMLRLTRWRPNDEIGEVLLDELEWYFPTEMSQVAKWADAVIAFEEADLRQCEGAITHLLNLSLPDRARFWDESELTFLPRHVPLSDNMFIDGSIDWSRVFVRAKNLRYVRTQDGFQLLGAGPESYFSSEESLSDPTASWAIKMREMVQPCLKPSEATPPWHKFVAAAEKTAE